MPRFGLSRDRGAVLRRVSLSVAMLVCLRGGLAFALRAAEPGRLDLRPSVQVDGEGLYLTQLVQNATSAPSLRLSDAPAFGKGLVLSRNRIAEMARTNGWEDCAASNWAGASQVRISRRARPLEEREALQLFTSVLQQQYIHERGELELHFGRPWTTLSVPDEALVLKILEMPNTGVSPTFIVRFEVQTARGESIGPWQTVLQARLWKEVWVSHSTLKRGDLVSQADIARERHDVLAIHEPLAELDKSDSELEITSQVQAGAPVLARDVRPRPVVHRGQTVSGVLQDGALQISLKVLALEDGAPGQDIRLLNPMTHRDLRGRVIDDQSVQLAL